MTTGISEDAIFDLENLERSKMFVDQDKSNYLWCLHCERAYKKGYFRLKNDLQMCPYSGCNGDTVMDGWDWARLREDRDNSDDYPETPEIGKTYPLYHKPTQ